MPKIRIESFGSVAPCVGDLQVRRLPGNIARGYGERVEVVHRTSAGDPEWATCDRHRHRRL